MLPEALRSRRCSPCPTPPASVSDFLVDTKMFIVDKKQNQSATTPLGECRKTSFFRERTLNSQPWILLSEGDNVAVATAAITAGAAVVNGILTRDKIEPGH